MEPSARRALEPAHFSVSARVAMQLGRESISSSITAVLELVKNAYDADAEKVSIRIVRTSGEVRSIVIEDDGVGMTQSDLMDRWMVLGTSNKQSAPSSERKGRALTGEKGLGRLGLDRLASRAVIRTHKRNASKAIELEIDWTKYEAGAEKLEAVSHPVFETELEPGEAEFGGTAITMFGLKDRWSDDEVSSLRRELALLLSPFASSQDFAISLEVSDNSSLSGLIEPPSDILQAATWRVYGSISTDGEVNLTMNSSHHDHKYSLGPSDWSEFVKGMGEKQLFGATSVQLYFIPREATRSNGATISRARITAFLNENQGVRIYRDGFRVKPYGQPSGEGDWLTLANRRVQNPQGVRQEGLWHVGPNQLVGGVFISRAGNPLLNDQTNREGLLEGAAFSQLRAFMLALIGWFEREHQRFERAKAPAPENNIETAARASQSASVAAAQSIQKLRAEINSAAADPNRDRASFSLRFNRLLKEIEVRVASSAEEAEKTVKTAKAVQEEADRQKDALANLASLGILAASFGHETVNWSGNLVKNAIQLELDVAEVSRLSVNATNKEVARRFSDLKADASRIRKFAKFTLGNVLREKRTKSSFSPVVVAQYVFQSFEELLRDDWKIDVSIVAPLPSTDGIVAYEADWECIFSNLITNSVWALRNTEAAKRKIELLIYRDAAEIVLEFLDSGHGLEAGTEEAVFQPTFTTKRNHKGEVSGTGLGLAIVKSFVVDNSQGSLSAIARGRLGGATIVMRVPRHEL